MVVLINSYTFVLSNGNIATQTSPNTHNTMKTNTLTSIVVKIALILGVVESAIMSKIAQLSGAKFIALNGYFAKTSGEISDRIINVNISVENAKVNDLQTLQSVTDNQLSTFALQSGIALDQFKTALSEMLTSATRNLSDDRTAQSIGQTEAYIQITPAIRFHKDSAKFHILGQSIAKKVLVAGTYKHVNSSQKTLAKNYLTENLNLRAGKIRTFIVDNIDTVKISGETFTD